MLFSEPKIPQTEPVNNPAQRRHRVSVLFSEPKIPQIPPPLAAHPALNGFSALQRAENSSNCSNRDRSASVGRCFSALQRAENSSNWLPRTTRGTRRPVSVLFSEPKIPQSLDVRLGKAPEAGVSVLFSEPKIPQRICRLTTRAGCGSFSALQRAENSSNPQQTRGTSSRGAFQCSSASRKFLKGSDALRAAAAIAGFSALQRAENSSNPTLAPASIRILDCDDRASSFLSLSGASP